MKPSSVYVTVAIVAFCVVCSQASDPYADPFDEVDLLAQYDGDVPDSFDENEMWNTEHVSYDLSKPWLQKLPQQEDMTDMEFNQLANFLNQKADKAQMNKLSNDKTMLGSFAVNGWAGTKQTNQLYNQLTNSGRVPMDAAAFLDTARMAHMGVDPKQGANPISGFLGVPKPDFSHDGDTDKIHVGDLSNREVKMLGGRNSLGLNPKTSAQWLTGTSSASGSNSGDGELGKATAAMLKGLPSFNDFTKNTDQARMSQMQQDQAQMTKVISSMGGKRGNSAPPDFPGHSSSSLSSNLASSMGAAPPAFPGHSETAGTSAAAMDPAAAQAMLGVKTKTVSAVQPEHDQHVSGHDANSKKINSLTDQNQALKQQLQQLQATYKQQQQQQASDEKSLASSMSSSVPNSLNPMKIQTDANGIPKVTSVDEMMKQMTVLPQQQHQQQQQPQQQAALATGTAAASTSGSGSSDDDDNDDDDDDDDDDDESDSGSGSGGDEEDDDDGDDSGSDVKAKVVADNIFNEGAEDYFH
eukprot:TRINITY_DN18_c2_g1_i1.p1 TRINITY_DN18_c2_g1~~TRINITY_DN18_c2_g1_i1.p1  ORF type:complete len:524 (+),score=176.80 TRINITY_DN18_c2_g1_i1:220-1791(+)